MHFHGIHYFMKLIRNRVDGTNNQGKKHSQGKANPKNPRQHDEQLWWDTLDRLEK